MASRLNVLRFIVTASIVILGCSTTKKSDSFKGGFSSANVEFTLMDGDIPNDKMYSSFIHPYRDSLEKKMSVRLGWALSDLTRARPEGSLGNFAAEAIRDYASTLLKKNVDMGLTNSGGLRTDIPKGEITLGDLFEVMPFENRLVIMELTGTEVISMLNDIAKVNGDPISGARFRIQNKSAVDIIVNGQPVIADSTYLLATSDFIANGGDYFYTLWDIKKRINTNYLVRDIMIEYVQNRKNISGDLDGRIRS